MTNITNKTVAIINSKAPFSINAGKDALDVALIFASFEQKVALFFQGDGVYQLVDKQTPELINVKNYLKTFSAFEFYDIEDIYVCEHSLKQRNLSACFHIDNVQILPLHAFTSTLINHQHIFRF